MTPGDYTGLLAALGVLGTGVVSVILMQTRRIRELTDNQTDDIKSAVFGIRQQITDLDSRMRRVERRTEALESLRARFARLEYQQAQRPGSGSSG